MAGRASVVSFVLLILFHYVLCFNIDTNIPVVKTGAQGTYFGYSIAQHQIYNAKNVVDENLFIVGAPRANVTVEEEHQDGSRIKVEVTGNGAVYRCNLDTSQKCERIKIKRAEYYWNYISQPVQSTNQRENYTNMWLGVTVKCQRARYPIKDGEPPVCLVCAHRYKRHRRRQELTNWGKGICYSLDNSLAYDMTLRPCGGQVVNGYSDTGYCMGGTGAEVTDDGNFLIGAPGAYTYHGLIYELGFLIGNRQSKIKDVTSQFSYLGFAVTSGKYSGDKIMLVGGAPRGLDSGNETRNNGIVVIFESGKQLMAKTWLMGYDLASMFGFSLCTEDVNNDGFEDLLVGAPFVFRRHQLIGGAVYIYLGSAKGIKNDTIPQILESRKMDQQECDDLGCTRAQFGYSIAALGDINRDGFNDIAISAPYEGSGVVYIYHGSKDGLRAEPSQKITPSQLNTKMNLTTFGSSLSGNLDLDNNGYPDLAIGAYQSDAAVLLRSRPIIKLFSNVKLTPKQINPTEKNKVCLFDNTVGEQCIQIQVCLRFTTDPVKTSEQEAPWFRSNVAIKYTIEGYKYSDSLVSRTLFKNAVDPTKNKVSKTVVLDKQSKTDEQCFTEIAYLQRILSDKQRPLKFAFTFELQERAVPDVSPGDPLPNINDYPILDTRAVSGETDTQIFDVDFINDCNGNICLTDLNLDVAVLLPVDPDTGMPMLSIGDHPVVDINVTITNNKEDAHMTMFYLQLPPSISYKDVSSDPIIPSVSCNPKNVSLVVCDGLGNPLAGGGSRWFIVKLNSPDKEKAQSELFKLEASVNTTSKEDKPADNTFTTHVKLITRTDMTVTGTPSPEQVLYSGQPIGESNIKTVEDIGREVNHTYRVRNAGPGTVKSSTLYIYWPYELTGSYPHGKHLLYLLDIPKVKLGSKGQPSVLCSVRDEDVGIIDPANILKRQRSRELRNKRERTKRETDAQEGSTQSVVSYTDSETDGDVVVGNDDGGRPNTLLGGRKKLKSVVLQCGDSGGARCVRIRCDIKEMKDKDVVEIVVNSRMWQSTFLQNFRKVEGVSIVSRAELVVPKDIGVIQDPKLDIAMAETTAIPDIKIVQEEQGLKWWIIMIAAIGGMLLLALIIIIFWKLGFFKRKRSYSAVATHEAKVEKQKEPVD